MSSKYSIGDIVTYFFIIYKSKDTGIEIIKAWTDNEKLAKFYFEFHKCKEFYIKSITKTIEEIAKILEENYHDEIVIFHALVKNREKNGDPIRIAIPATKTEVAFVNEECQGFMSSRIDYGYLNSTIPYLKKEYRNAIDDIFLSSIIFNVINSNYDFGIKTNKSPYLIELDQLMVLFKSFPSNFGK